jgi:hypothetical protein
MSCRQRPEYRRLTSSATHQVEEFEVATGGGSWVAAGATPSRAAAASANQPASPSYTTSWDVSDPRHEPQVERPQRRGNRQRVAESHIADWLAGARASPARPIVSYATIWVPSPVRRDSYLAFQTRGHRRHPRARLTTACNSRRQIVLPLPQRLMDRSLRLGASRPAPSPIAPTDCAACPNVRRSGGGRCDDGMRAPGRGPDPRASARLSPRTPRSMRGMT